MEAVNFKNQAPNEIPAKCLNPSCGISFMVNNPVFIGGNSTNISFTGNKTRCPRCNQTAMIQNWEIDSKGQFHLRELISELYASGQVRLQLRSSSLYLND